MSDDTIVRVAKLEARCEARPWPWAERNRDAIAANWARRQATTPRLFNGRVLLVAEDAVERDTLRVTFFEVNYAAFLAWIDLGFPDRSVANGFAMGALQGADGAFVLGVMAANTANAGQVYFPAGTPDRSDLRPDGTVDLAASVTRELREETGLDEGDGIVGEDWIVVRSGALIAFLRPIRFAEPAEAVRQRILRNLERQNEPELSDVRLARSPADIDERVMPAYLRAFLRWSFDEAQR